MCRVLLAMRASTRSMVILGVLLALPMVLSSCVRLKAPVIPPPGLIYTEYQAPLDFNMGNEMKKVGTDEPRTPITDLKVGTSEAQYIWIPLNGALSFAWGDADYKTAAESAGIERIDYVDYEFLSVLGIYVDTKIHVYGQ